jgi:hypothetical protein
VDDTDWVRRTIRIAEVALHIVTHNTKSVPAGNAKFVTRAICE